MKEKIIAELVYYLKKIGIHKHNLIRNFIFSTEYILHTKPSKGIRNRNEFELKTAIDFCTYVAKHDREKDTRNLVKGLDTESRHLIETLINRYFYFYNHNVVNEDDYHTSEEFREYIKVEDYIINNRKRLSEFMWRKYDCGVFYYKHGLVFLPQKVLKTLNDRDFIDGGSYLGDSAFVFTHDFNPRKIYSFEPNKTNYGLLTKTLKFNNLNKVVAVQHGLGEKRETVSMINDGVSSYIDKEGKEKISIIPLDEYVKSEKLNVGLIKLDIEGYELEAIKGAKYTIKKFKPILLISIYHTGKDFFEIKPMLESWVPEYKFIVKKLNPMYGFADTMLIGHV